MGYCRGRKMLVCAVLMGKVYKCPGRMDGAKLERGNNAVFKRGRGGRGVLTVNQGTIRTKALADRSGCTTQKVFGRRRECALIAHSWAKHTFCPATSCICEERPVSIT